MDKFKITITNLETGNVEVDEETNCIIGAVITDGGEGTMRIGMIECDAFSLTCAIAGARMIIDESFAEYPLLEQLVTTYEHMEAMNATKGEKEQNEDE